MMNLLKIHPYQRPYFLHPPQTTSISAHSSLPHILKFSCIKSTPFSPSGLFSSFIHRPTFKILGVSEIQASFLEDKEEREGGENSLCEFDDLAPDGHVYLNTLRLVECAMFAAVTGLVYFLSNSLAIENYFGCFFSLPIVLSSLRWGVAAGRKTMVATAMLLFVLSGPVKALTYLLTHGVLGVTMGSLWRLRANWRLSIFLCTIARATGAVGYVLTTSFLIRENILALITINIHASLTYIFSAVGLNIVPSMNLIYTLFGILVLLNSGFFVFLLHLLYSLILTRLGMRDLLRLPNWLEKALSL